MKRTNLFAGVAAAAMMLTGATLAQAADMPLPAVYDWSGIYLGVHVGVGGFDADGVIDNASTPLNLGALGEVGFLGGGQVGWNWQTGGLVFGIEGDIAFVDWDDSAFKAGGTKVAFDADFLATVRGRIGWAVENVLLYATGGVAFLEGDISENGGPSSKDISSVGGVVGVGLEWGVTESLSVKVEGLYLFFDNDTSLFGTSDGDPGDNFEIEDAVVARVGVNWRFNLFH